MPVRQNMKTINAGVRRKPMHTQYSAPPTHRADSLAHHQSENPMVQMSDSQPPQTLPVESDQKMSERLRKLPTQLNTPNRFVPDLVQVFTTNFTTKFHGGKVFQSASATKQKFVCVRLNQWDTQASQRYMTVLPRQKKCFLKL